LTQRCGHGSFFRQRAANDWVGRVIGVLTAIMEGKMAYEAFDSETLHILGGAMDEAWRRVKLNHLNGDANAARTVLASHIFAMARKGERDHQRLIAGALMRLTL
jgi:hypothetical protein